MLIRKDIYPTFKSPQKQEILENQINIVFEVFKELFSSKESLINYINNFKKPDTAELFIEIGLLYRFAKFQYCPDCGRKLKECPECKKQLELPSFTVLTIILSLIERLSRKLKKHMEFINWVEKDGIIRKYDKKFESKEIMGIKELIQSMKQEYLEDYGSATKITRFFIESLNDDGKIEFVKSIRYAKKVPNLFPRFPSYENMTIDEIFKSFQEEEKQIRFATKIDVKKYVEENRIESIYKALPICFNEETYWECYSIGYDGTGLGFCDNLEPCCLQCNKKMLDEKFEETIKTIYDWRSDWVHGERLPPIIELMPLVDTYKKKPIIVELTTNKLKSVFERMLKEYFDKQQRV